MMNILKKFKLRIRALSLFALCLFFLTQPTFILARGGDVVGNGGNFIGLQFTRTADSLVRHLKNNLNNPRYQSIFDKLSIDNLERAITNTDVEVVYHDIFDIFGNKVDARFLKINGLATIQLYGPAWSRFLFFSTIPLQMVFHEYLRVLEIDDDNYKQSKVLVESENLQDTFAALKEAFKTADPIEFEDIKDQAFSGSCVDKFVRDEASSSLIVALEANGQDKKPFIGESTVPGAPSDYYDRFKEKDAFQEIINSPVLNDWDNPLRIFDDLAVFHFPTDLHLFIRKDGPNLISAYIDMSFIETTDPGRWSQIYPDAIEILCFNSKLK